MNRALVAMLLAALVMVANAPLVAIGQGDVCVHLSNGITGPDTALIGFDNTLEIWIANDAMLIGISPALTVTFTVPLEWYMQYGSHPPVNEEGRAVGAWNLPDLQVADDFDNVSPEHFLLGGAAMPGFGLPAGQSELCYSLRFKLLEGNPDSSAGMCVTNYCYPADTWWFTEYGDSYRPSFCDQPILGQWYEADPICFPAIQLPWICGDAVRDGWRNISDAVFLINYVYAGGDAPDPVNLGDVDCDGSVEVADVLYLIAYIFGRGPAPCANCPR